MLSVTHVWLTWLMMSDTYVLSSMMSVMFLYEDMYLMPQFKPEKVRSVCSVSFSSEFTTVAVPIWGLIFLR